MSNQFCTKCGGSIPEGSAFCPNCGEPVAQAAPQQPQYQQPAPQAQAPTIPAPGGNTWTCEFGAVNTGKFCNECGKQRPAPAETWTCKCGTVNTGKFCTECGNPRPQKLTACPQCGAPIENPDNPPKFCPECGFKLR
jgi:membrane protease subunit (stomatin/prohibitin family)